MQRGFHSVDLSFIFQRNFDAAALDFHALQPISKTDPLEKKLISPSYSQTPDKQKTVDAHYVSYYIIHVLTGCYKQKRSIHDEITQFCQSVQSPTQVIELSVPIRRL